MNVVESATIAARDFLNDPRRFFHEIVTPPNSVQTVFRLGYTNVDTRDLTVTVDGVGFTSWEVVDADEGYIRFTTPPVAGSLVEVTGWYWDWFSDNKLKRYVGYAYTNYQTAEGDPDSAYDLFYENHDAVTVLGMAGAVEALWAAYVEAARMIDVSSPEVSIPARQRYQQLGGLLGQKVGELRQAEQALNLGRYKIEMVTLRRISRTTGRYVPIFKGQEWDDPVPWPERILPPIDDGVIGR